VLYRLPRNNINSRKEIEVMKKLIFLLLPFLLLITSVLAQCVTPYENIEINTSTTFCTGTYYLNDTDTNGVINITGDNLILDCNSSTFVGNDTLNSVGIYITGNRVNVTIKNCILRGYYNGIVAYENLSTVYIIDNNITSDRSCIYIGSSDGTQKDLNDTYILRNYFHAENLVDSYTTSGIGIYRRRAFNLNIKDNNFTLKGSTNKYGIKLYYKFSYNNVNISGNLIEVYSPILYDGITVGNGVGVYIKNNTIKTYFSGDSTCVEVFSYQGTSSNAEIVGNYFDCNNGIGLHAISDVYVADNVMYVDARGITRIYSGTVTNATFYNNFITTSGDMGYHLNDYSTVKVESGKVIGANVSNSYGIYLSSSTDGEITNVEIKYFGDNIFVGSSSSITIEGITSSVSVDDGIEFSSVTDSIIKDTYIEHTSDDSVFITLSSNITIENVTSINTGDSGIFLNSTNDSTVKESYIEGGYIGIYLKDGARCKVENNTITGQYYGITVSYHEYPTVRGNNATNYMRVGYSFDYNTCDGYLGVTEENNYANGKLIYYLELQDGVVLEDIDSTEVYVINFTNSTIRNLTTENLWLICSDDLKLRDSYVDGKAGTRYFYTMFFDGEIWNTIFNDSSYLRVSSSTIKFYNSIIIVNSSTYEDLRILSSNITAINVSFDTPEPSIRWYDTTSEFYRGWWLNLTIKPVSASVRIVNKLDKTVFEGVISKIKIALMEYKKYYDGVDEVTVSYTPHTISADAYGYYPKSVSITMDDNKGLVIDLGVMRFSRINPIYTIMVVLMIPLVFALWIYHIFSRLPTDIFKAYLIVVAISIVAILLSVLFQYL